MTAYFGDYDTTETVIIPFNTFDSNDPQASVTMTNLAATDIHIHKDGGTTQRSSSSGVTVSIDFDTITGNHICSIDLSDNTDAGFYAAGSRYQVRMEGTTVDAATINAWIGTFSIGCVLRPTTDGRTLDVTSTGAAGIDWGNIENASTAVDLSGTDIQLCDTITTYTGNTVQTGDAYARLGAAGAGLTAVPWNASWDAEVQSEVNDGLVALGLDHLVGASVTGTDVTDNSIIAKLVSKSATADWDDFVNTTDSLQAQRDNIGTPAGADIATDIATVDTVVDGIQTDLSNGTDGLGALLSAINSVMTTAMTESYSTDGGTATPAQALYLIMQMLTEANYAGTTCTVKKLDGSTTAFTLTLDSATNPTSITRAT